MTSPSQPQGQPPTPSRPSRPPRSPSSSGTRRAHDPEARFTRNVTIAFAVIIGAAVVAVVIGLGYGFWESNFRALASVQGTQIDRRAWEERQRLEAFRADRAESATRASLLAGAIDEDLADRRLGEIDAARAAGASGAMDELVDLIYRGQLAGEMGITLAEDELAAALAADGTFPEARRIGALVVSAAGAATGQTTAQDRIEARARAEEARAALEAGTPIADLVEEYSPATTATDGDLGYGTLDDLRNIDAVWADALFALEEGGITEIVESGTGDLLIGVVTTIVPEEPDPGFLSAVREEIGEDVHRRHVEMEALAEKLQDRVTADALAADYEQVRLAEILVAGDTLVAPEEDEGSVRARHILYQPELTEEAEASPEAAASLEPEASSAPDASAEPDASAAPAASLEPEASTAPDASGEPAATPSPEVSPEPFVSPEPSVSPDPSPSPDPAEDEAAWAQAQADAERTAADLRAMADVEARRAAFIERAATDGDDATARNGGDLGFFERADMVPEFADPIFDAEDPRAGDIIGPVRSQFGWHVIMYEEARAPIAERLAAVQEALAAPGADFATVASELSDGAEAEDGGEIGWRIIEDLDELTVLALTAIEVGEHTEPLDSDGGYVIYQKLEEATRPLEPAEAARKARFAFSDWYDDRRFDAQDAGQITIDDSVYAE